MALETMFTITVGALNEDPLLYTFSFVREKEELKLSSKEAVSSIQIPLPAGTYCFYYVFATNWSLFNEKHVLFRVPWIRQVFKFNCVSCNRIFHFSCLWLHCASIASDPYLSDCNKNSCGLCTLQSAKTEIKHNKCLNNLIRRDCSQIFNILEDIQLSQ